MDLHYLRIFYEVAKEKSFTKAATTLYINQSAVSIQIKKFEEVIGVRLFDRTSKKIKLTYTGELLFRMAEDIFEKVKRTEKELARIIGLSKAKITIGSTSVIGEPLLPRLLQEFGVKNSEIEYDIVISEKKWLLKNLKEGDLDVLIIDEEHIIDSELEVSTLQKMPYVLVGIKDYENMADVASVPLITRKSIPNNNKAIASLEEKYKVSFINRIDVTGNLEIIKGMISEGIGNCILPYYSVQKEVETGTFKVITKINDVKDGFQVVITKDKKNVMPIIKFINFLQQYISK